MVDCARRFPEHINMDTTGDRNFGSLRLAVITVKDNFFKHRFVFMAYLDAELTSNFITCLEYFRVISVITK